MPVKRIFSKRSRRLDDYKRQQLLDGPDSLVIAGVGYFATAGIAKLNQATMGQRAQIVAEMTIDWQHHGAALLEWWALGDAAPTSGLKPWAFVVAGGPDRLPWAARQFGRASAVAGPKF